MTYTTLFRSLKLPAVRIVDRLTEQAVCVGHDRRDDIDQLGQARHLDSVRVAQQGVEQATHEQSILQIVELLKLVRRFLVMPVRVIAAPGSIRYVPFEIG